MLTRLGSAANVVALVRHRFHFGENGLSFLFAQRAIDRRIQNVLFFLIMHRQYIQQHPPVFITRRVSCSANLSVYTVGGFRIIHQGGDDLLTHC